MQEWIHATQKVEIATMCRPPRSRGAKIVREVVEIPYRIRVLDGAQAPVAFRLDQDAVAATEKAYKYGLQGQSLHYNFSGAGTVLKTGVLEYRSSPEGFLCLGSGTIEEHVVGQELWERLMAVARATIEKGKAPFTGSGYAGPAGAVDIEWSTYDAARLTVQRMVDDMFVCGGRIFCPAETPYLMKEYEKQGHQTAWAWCIRNHSSALKSDNVYLSLKQAAREMPDFANCVEIVDESLIPGIGSALIKSVAAGLTNPSFSEIILAGDILRAVGAGEPWAKPVDWDALETLVKQLRNLRDQFRIPNEPCRIFLDLPEEERGPAPIDRSLNDDPEGIFQL